MATQPKRIVVLITRMDLGGAQQVALETVRRLDRSRFDPVLISGPGGMLDAEASETLESRFLTLSWLRHPISPWHDLLSVFWLAAYFLKNRIEVVHTHSSKAGLLGRVAAWLAGVPVVVHTVHGWSFHDFMPPATRRLYALLERWMARASTCLVVVARSLAAKGLAHGIGRSSQYQVIRAAVDLQPWESQRRSRLALAREIKLPPKSRVVGCLANCKDQKNPLDFVRVARRVLERFPETRFVYIGDGPLRPQAEELARELGIGAKVHFLGWKQKVPALVAGFDIFLLVSLWEGLPCVFPQAMSLGLPVVATAVDGASEIVSEGETGYLCQPHDVSGLADRVCLLLARPVLRRRMGLEARRRVLRQKEWRVEDMVQRTQELYAR